MSSDTLKSSELVDKAMSLVKQAIEINKKLSGIDFSSFFATVMNLISTEVFGVMIEVQSHRYTGDVQFQITGNERIRDLFVVVALKVLEVERLLKKDLQGKRIFFMDIPKAITAIGLIRACDCHDELERIEGFVEELISVCADEEVNHKATSWLLRSLIR